MNNFQLMHGGYKKQDIIPKKGIISKDYHGASLSLILPKSHQRLVDSEYPFKQFIHY
jgi:hypothetical protein